MMKEYHKIDTVFKRDPATKHKSLMVGQYSNPAFEYLKDNIWTFTEKVDGTNIRVMFAGGQVSFGGKTDTASIPALLVDRLRTRFAGADVLLQSNEIFQNGACLYGEGYGAKIQSGGNYRPDQDFVLFDVRVGQFWLQRSDVEDVAMKLGIDIVPIIGRGTLSEMVTATRFGVKSQWGDFEAEGIVARPVTEMFDRAGNRVITKIKHRDFLHAESGRVK